MGGDGGAGPTDAWTTLAGLARETSTIRLGTLVTSATFRLPGPLAVQVAGVDQMSGGRVELGLGAGWFEAEHTAYGIPFPPLGERFDRLEEQLAVITGLWATETGRDVQPQRNPLPRRRLPRPRQAGPGGWRADHHRRWRASAARPRSPSRYAAEFNAAFASAAESGRLFERVRDVAREAGRDPGSLTCSAAQVVCVGNDEATLRRRAAAIGRDVDELRANGLAGSADEIVERDRGVRRRSAPSGSTSRSSTSPTSTTSPTSPRACCARSPDAASAGAADEAALDAILASSAPPATSVE